MQTNQTSKETMNEARPEPTEYQLHAMRLEWEMATEKAREKIRIRLFKLVIAEDIELWAERRDEELKKLLSSSMNVSQKLMTACLAQNEIERLQSKPKRKPWINFG